MILLWPLFSPPPTSRRCCTCRRPCALSRPCFFGGRLLSRGLLSYLPLLVSVISGCSGVGSDTGRGWCRLHRSRERWRRLLGGGSRWATTGSGGRRRCLPKHWRAPSPGRARPWLWVIVSQRSQHPSLSLLVSPERRPSSTGGGCAVTDEEMVARAKSSDQPTWRLRWRLRRSPRIGLF